MKHEANRTSQNKQIGATQVHGTKLCQAMAPSYGIHLMRTGLIEANLLTLNGDAKLTYLNDLIALKSTGPEKGAVESIDLAFHESEYGRLTCELEAAYTASKLSELPSSRAASNDLLVRLRMKAIMPKWVT